MISLEGGVYMETELVKQIKKWIFEACRAPDLNVDKNEIKLDHPVEEKFGDYSTNMAMLAAKKLKQNPSDLARNIKYKLDEIVDKTEIVDKIETVGGFINFYLKLDYLKTQAEKVNFETEYRNQLSHHLANKRFIVEFAHPNTHKELHIGHMRTLITGEALSRIFSFTGANVFRANYQGDIGPHVAKAIWGTKKILGENKETFNDWENKSFAEKAHLLGKGYVLGCGEYEKDNKEIDELNQKLYDMDPAVLPEYSLTREWSLGYYNEFYQRFGTKFDKLFFESEIADEGKKIASSLVGKILKKSNGAIIFDGEQYGLHKRVFITNLGTPTYEGKELGLAYAQKKAFEYDWNIHVVANEQADYFKVVIKVIELMDSWFTGKQYHLSMGMVNLVGKKMSSRTGEIITVDSLLDEVKQMIRSLIKSVDLTNDEIETIAEIVTIGAVKFSVLKTSPTANSIFDLKKSVDINGDSGPYLQYTYARCQSVLRKTKILEQKDIEEPPKEIAKEEMTLLREYYKFEEKIVEAAERFNPSIVAEYLLSVARKYNEFYDKHRIVDDKNEVFRVFLTKTTASVIHLGLGLLGIKTVEKM